MLILQSSNTWPSIQQSWPKLWIITSWTWWMRVYSGMWIVVELRQRLVETWTEFQRSIVGEAIEQWRNRLRPVERSSPLKRSAWITQLFTLQITPCCLHLVNIHQRAWPLASGSSHLITAYYSFIDPERMKGWVGLVQRTVYPYKWLPISCRSGADQWKFRSMAMSVQNKNYKKWPSWQLHCDCNPFYSAIT